MTDPHALFRAQQAAQAAFDADTSFENLHALEAADRAFYAALAEARAIWQAFPEGYAKASAETNAEDTEGTAENELLYLDVAIRTYEMTPEGGW